MRKVCVVGVAVVLLAGCGGDGADDVALEPPSASASASASTGPSAAATTAAPSQLPFRPSDLEDGRHATFLTGIDVSARTLTVDVIQFLTDDAADEAYWRSSPSSSPEPVPNDYFIVNDNPRLRTLSVDRGVAVSVVWQDGSVPQTLSPRSLPFDELPAYLGEVKPDGRLSSDPFWLRLVDGVVVGIEEQYVP